MSMKSTGTESFTVYVYIRAFKDINGIEKLWAKYDEEEDGPPEDKSAEISDGDGNGPLLLKSKSEQPFLSRQISHS